MNILYVEDDQSNYCLIETLLEKKGKKYNLIRSTNGAEAISMAKASDLDIILMDIVLPEMDGIEATKKIRTFNKNIPIIAYTADAHLPRSEDAKLFTDIIVKPTNIKEVYEKIDSYLQ